MEKQQEINNQLKLLLSSVMPSYNFDYWQDSTELFGALPEFDSMAIVTLLTELEEHLDIEFDDDDVSAENFATVGSLRELILNTLS